MDRRNRLILLLAALPICATIFAGPVNLGEARPLFEKPDFYSERAGSVGPGEVYSSEEVLGWSVKHPLARYDDFHSVESPQGKRWFSPDVREVDGVCFSVRPIPMAVLWGIALTAAALAVAVGRMVLRRSADAWELLLCALLLRQFLALCEFGFQGNCIPSAADDPGYFETMRDMLDGKFSGPWKFTIGTGIFYFPFILILKAARFYDIAIAFDWFSALFLAPAAMALGFLILRKLRIPKFGAFAATAIWAVWPFFVFHIENWNLKYFAPFLGTPTFFDGYFDWWRYYSAAINAGFNAMSDTPGMVTLFGTIYLALTLKPEWKRTAAVGALFGFACLIRINYIFFAPLLGFLILRKMELSWKTFLTAALSGGAGFLLLFGWQLWFNFHQFGSPLTFGYSLHYPDFAPEKRPAAGFTFGTLLEWTNLRFLIGGNRLLLTFAIPALLLIRDRFRRAVLGYWGIVLILFFLGYSHTYCDVRRFILPGYIALLGSVAGLEVWNFRSSRPWRKAGYPAAVAILYFTASAEVLGILLTLVFCRSVFDMIQSFRLAQTTPAT